jgi:hypothetical protein
MARLTSFCTKPQTGKIFCQTGQPPGRLFVETNPCKVHTTLNNLFSAKPPDAIARCQWG